MKWSKKTITPKASMVFLLSLIGLGYLFYFQGRSHSINLSVSSGFCILLLTVLGDELWLTIRTRSVLALNAVFVIFLFWVSFSFIELVYNTDKIVNQVYGEDVKSLYGNQKIFLESNREFLVNNSAEHEKILVLTVSRYQSLYFDENNRRSAFNPGLSDLFLNANMDRLRDVIRDSSFKVFIEPQLFNYSYAQTTIATVAAVDELTAAGKTMALLTKRKHLLPAATFFNSAVPLIVHRKYTDDTAGIRSRVNDASGIGRVTLNPEFSVQLLFFSTFQIYPFAALAGNLQDGKGFVIGNEFNTMNYYCVVNDNSFKFPVPENQWVHLAINGFRDHVAVYVNGSFAGGNQLPGPVKQSDIPFCIGNLGELHYFTGGISEVAVQNNSLDTNQIRKTWEEIRQVINK